LPGLHSIQTQSFMQSKLIFVYNADSGFFSTLTDFAHKIISPDTYSCNLCKITYGNTGMKKEWKDFIKSLPVKSEFLHKDEFVKKHPEENNQEFPCIYVLEKNKLELLISVKEINSTSSLDSLISLTKNKLK
jgi:hypothetical protein